MGACLNQQPAVRVVIGPLVPIALLVPKLDDFADVLKGQVQRGLTKLLDELAGVRFVAPGRRLVMNRQAHIVLLAFMVQRQDQSVTHEMALAAQHHLAAAARAFWPRRTVLKPVPFSIIDIRPRGFYGDSNVKSP